MSLLGRMLNLLDAVKGQPLGKSAKREPLFLEMLGRGLGQGPVTMISIGSSDGVESMYALSQKGVDVEIHLLEPDPVNLKNCRRNISRRFPTAKQVHYHNLGVSNHCARGRFFRNPEAPNLNSATPIAGSSEEFEVEYVTLDHFLESQHIDGSIVINMDIEGHEVEVLEGFLSHALSEHRVSILMEVHPSLYNEQHSLEKIIERYFASGYRTDCLESAGPQVPDKFKEHSLQPARIAKSRALYTDLDDGVVLDAACHEHLNPVNDSGRVTREIVRSILLVLDAAKNIREQEDPM